MTRCRLSVEPLETRDVPTTLPPGFTESSVAAGLNGPTAMAVAPDGRVFVSEQGGTLRVVQDGQLLPTPFLSLPVDSSGERGLLGVALDPSFTTDHFVYVYHTVPAAGGAPAFNRISRFTAAGNIAVPGSEQVLVDLDPLSSATNHNGGAIHFGPDGKLYVGVGENANSANSQSLTTRLGKILRYNPDGSIPADNPTAFAGLAGTTTGVDRAIWAVGLRNPFTFAFQPGTGRLLINDVGQSSWEEVDAGGPGRNYGWPATEGDFDPAQFPNFTRPVFTYTHGAGNDKGAGIIGATFYDPQTATFPADYAGDYFFGDLANRWVKRLDPATGTVTTFATDMTGAALVDLAVTPQGDLLYLARGSGAGDGAVYRVSYAAPQPVPPRPTNTPPEAVAVGAGPGEPAVVRTIDPATGTELSRQDLGAVSLTPLFTGETRVATADVNGDGVPDLIVGAGPGGPSYVVVYDGKAGGVLATLTAFEPSYTGGVFVAAGDVEGTGKADVIVTPDQGGGPRVKVVRPADGAVVADFYGIDDPAFRGGARAAAADVNGDGRTDVVVAAGVGGGPRVAGWDGRQLAAGQLVRAFADFFAFEPSVRDGVFVAAADLNGDRKADLVIGGGPGGGPRVLILDGAALVASNQQSVLGNFFAGDPADRGGVRVTVKDVDGDGWPDVVAGLAGRVRGFRGPDFPTAGTPAAATDQPAFTDGSTGVVYVG